MNIRTLIRLCTAKIPKAKQIAVEENEEKAVDSVIREALKHRKKKNPDGHQANG